MSDDWLQTQRKYWEEWTALSGKALGLEAPKANAWEGALEHWWKAMAPAAPDMSRDFMEKMMEQGKMFFRMADSFTRDLSPAGGPAGDPWGALTRTLDEMQKAFGGDLQQGDQALHKMLAFWELPYDNWQRMMSSLSPVPGDLLRNMPHDQVKEGVARFLSAPGLGYAREEQSQYQDLGRRALAYQKALQEYLSFFNQLGVKSTERMRQTLAALAKGDKAIDSARDLYDTWIGCCEAVYGEEVQSPEYARIHGQLINAQMALKHRMSVIVDEALGAMNMPTRSELRTLQDRLQETRRENKALRRDLDALKQQVAALAGTAGRAAIETAPAAPPATKATKKVPARKKATVRKKATAKVRPS